MFTLPLILLKCNQKKDRLPKNEITPITNYKTAKKPGRNRFSLA